MIARAAHDRNHEEIVEAIQPVPPDNEQNAEVQRILDPFLADGPDISPECLAEIMEQIELSWFRCSVTNALFVRMHFFKNSVVFHEIFVFVFFSVC